MKFWRAKNELEKDGWYVNNHCLSKKHWIKIAHANRVSNKAGKKLHRKLILKHCKQHEYDSRNTRDPVPDGETIGDVIVDGVKWLFS